MLDKDEGIRGDAAASRSLCAILQMPKYLSDGSNRHYAGWREPEYISQLASKGWAKKSPLTESAINGNERFRKLNTGSRKHAATDPLASTSCRLRSEGRF